MTLAFVHVNPETGVVQEFFILPHGTRFKPVVSPTPSHPCPIADLEEVTLTTLQEKPP